MVNMSLHQNCFPDLWKEAIVQPRLKKVELDASFANLRPVSNLAYISKLTEKAVFRQLHKHMASNNLYPTLQSAYRNNHNTESSLLKVFNDILLEMNNQNVTLLVFLDLSAAFDTIDHNILIARLNSNLGIPEPALSWFKEYLSDRSQRVSINRCVSKKFIISSGVPQGSCSGALLFIIYASDLFKVLNKHSVKAHAYADDSQLYLSFKPGHIDNQNAATNTITNCIKDIQRWMTCSKLKMNDGKTDPLREKRRVVARKSHDTDPYSLRIRANPGVSCSMKRDVSAACQEPYFPRFGLFPWQGKSGLRTPPRNAACQGPEIVLFVPISYE